MATRTITAMFMTRVEADRAAAAVKANTALGTTNVKVLPEEGMTTTTIAETERREEGGFMNTLKNFFMPEEDRYGYAEGLRRGSFMVAVEVDDTNAHHVMDILEESGAVDLDAEEARWRNEGWKGYEPGMSATSSAAMVTPAPGAMGQPAGMTTGSTMAESPVHMGVAPTEVPPGSVAADMGTEERIQLVEESLRVGKRQVVEGRVRIRSYVVETPVTETVHLRDEHVEIERRPVDRTLTSADEDLFRERVIEAVESSEEAVVSKDVRVREELVVHKSVHERDETIHDTVRRTEVQDEGDVAVTDRAAAVRTPDGSRL